jgi:integrase/recombinase XerD
MRKANTLKPTFAIILEKRYNLSDGTHPVKLRVTFNRVQKYYAFIDVDSEDNSTLGLSEKDFKLFYTGIPKTKEGKEIRKRILAFETAASEVADNMKEPFTFERWHKIFFEDKIKPKSGNLIDLITDHAKDLRKENAFSTAITYECTRSCIERFTGGKQVSIHSVNTEWLKRFRAFMLSGNKPMSPTTISIYLRCLRQIFNKAIKEGELSPEQYPFTQKNFIPTSKNTKKALTMEDIELIYKYIPKNDSERFARDLWLFSYICNGANIKDIAGFKHTNIEGDKIVFKRAKTEGKSDRTIEPIITPEAQAIINRWANPRGINSYLFPILNNQMTAEEKFKAVRQRIKTVNKYMKRISESLELGVIPTTYFARHSYATIMKRAGVPIAFISESLGHNNLLTTQNYLGSFEDSAKREHAGKLFSFGNAR